MLLGVLLAQTLPDSGDGLFQAIVTWFLWMDNVLDNWTHRSERRAEKTGDTSLMGYCLALADHCYRVLPSLIPATVRRRLAAQSPARQAPISSPSVRRMASVDW